GKVGHVHQLINDDGGAGVDVGGEIGEIARVKQGPVAVIIMEWKGIDGKAVGLAVHKDGVQVAIRTFRMVARRYAQLKFFRLDSTDAIEQIVFAVVAGEFGRPVLVLRVFERRLQRATQLLPVYKVSGAQQSEDASIRCAFVAGGAGGVVVAVVLNHRRV